jgi:hypothetical protein
VTVPTPAGPFDDSPHCGVGTDDTTEFRDERSHALGVLFPTGADTVGWRRVTDFPIRGHDHLETGTADSTRRALEHSAVV